MHAVQTPIAGTTFQIATMKSMPLVLRIFAPLALAMFLAGLPVAWFYTSVMADNARALVKSELDTMMRLLVDASMPYLAIDDTAALGGFVRALQRDPLVASVELRDSLDEPLTRKISRVVPDDIPTLSARESIVRADGSVLGSARIVLDLTALERERVANLWLAIGAVTLLGLFMLPAVMMAVRAVTRQIGGDPSAARDAVDRISNGDISTGIELRDGDSTSLLAAVARMVEKLRETVQSIDNSGRNVAATSAEIAASNTDLSARTEGATVSVARASSNADAVLNMLEASAGNAAQATERAQQVAEAAASGGASIGSAMESMQQITRSSHRIGEISTVIDTIAFQTNILALNAAVEAARAGDQGRGFAVVAGEVRQLAQRTSISARQIKELITGSVAEVGEGSRRVSEASTAIGQLAEHTGEVAAIVAQIDESASAQREHMRELNHMLAEIEQVTQQNAAMVQLSSSAAISLRDQAVSMAAVIEHFKAGGAKG
ncbi:MAG: methyl-accepting chemotaxis protein [Burkholderiaceae bacterium]